MLKPLNKNIVLKMVEEEQTAKGGLIVTGQTKENPSIGEVVAKSDEITSIALENIVIIPKFSGTKVNYNNIEYNVVNIEDVLAIIEED